MSATLILAPDEIPEACHVLRTHCERVEITRDDEPAACDIHLVLAPERTDRAYVATAIIDGEEFLVAKGHSEAQALHHLDGDVAEIVYGDPNDV